MIFTVIEKPNFNNLFDDLVELCREAQDNFYQDIKNDFATENFQERTQSFLHKLYISQEIEYLTCLFVNENELCGVSGITFEDKDTAHFSEFTYVKRKYRSNLNKTDIFLEQIKLIRKLGFSKAICIRKSYKRSERKYFIEMNKIKSLQDIVIYNDNCFGVYLKKEI